MTTTQTHLWDPVEALPPDQLRALQLQRLRETVARTARVPFYQEALAGSHFKPDQLRTLADLRRLPLTVKDDLRQHYPLGLLAVPREQVVRIHGSSGTTGRLTIVAYNQADLETWADLCARFLVAGGLHPGQLVHIAFGYGLFTGGFGLHQGVQRVGAGIIPAAAGNTRRHVQLLKDLQPQVLICTPSYALNIAEVARGQGIQPGDLALEAGHFGAEPWTQDMRLRLEAELGIQAFNNYGLSEVMGPGVAGECTARNGMHLHEDHFLVECLHPQTLQPVPDGQVGELVITTLTKQAMPLLRYRTRDLAQVFTGPCPCGRTHRRISRIVGRSDDMLIIRGVNVFPSQIEEALLRIKGTSPHYLIEVSRPGTLDELTVHVEVHARMLSDEMKEMHALRQQIDREIHGITGVHANIRLVQPESLERSQGKAVRVIDHRKLKDTP